jgi:hypothetical protein
VLNAAPKAHPILAWVHQERSVTPGKSKSHKL